MTPETIEAEMAQARAHLPKLGSNPRGHYPIRSIALMRRLLALWAWTLNPKAQQAREEFAGN